MGSVLCLASMLNLCVIAAKARLKLSRIFGISVRILLKPSCVATCSRAKTRAAPTHAHIEPVLTLARALDTCLDAACMCHLLWACTDVGVGAFLAFFFVQSTRSQVNKC